MKAVTEVIDSAWYLAVLAAIPGLMYLTWDLICGKNKGRIEREMDYLDKLIERVEEMEFKGPLNKPKFQVGDEVIGNEKARIYSLTNEGTICVVEEILDDDYIRVSIPETHGLFTVRSDCFNLATKSQVESKRAKFKVGDVVTVRKEAEKYGITVLRCELIVSEILYNGMIKVYIPLSNGGKSTEIVYNPEWLEPVERQTPDIPETEKSKTIMEQWATESSTFSRNLMNLLKEFGFDSTYQVKYQILGTFSEGYLKMFPKLKTNTYGADEISVVKLAKALLVASAYLETDNLEEIIDWADKN